MLNTFVDLPDDGGVPKQDGSSAQPDATVDAGRDVRVDVRTEGGSPDASLPEAGLPETGFPETGAPETGSPDVDIPDGCTINACGGCGPLNARPGDPCGGECDIYACNPGGGSVTCRHRGYARVTALAAGGYHTCALTDSGNVHCWGDGSDGEVGSGRAEMITSPPINGVMGGVQAIAAGRAHTCALTTSGGVRCWGENYQGELGTGDQIGRLQPPATDAISGAQAIVTGWQSTCSLLSSGGAVRCWGENNEGQIGDGTNNPRVQPPAFDVLSGVVGLAGGIGSTCALMGSPGIRCWGYNDYGQLGDGSMTSRSTPPTTDIALEAVSVSASLHTCALSGSGGVRCWGLNSSGQLGDGTTVNRASPPSADVLTGVLAVATGWYHTCALTTAGGVRCWGDDSNGQLGDGPGGNVVLTPPTADVLTGVQAVAAGGMHTCAIMTTGGIRCWGNNASGQLGDGTQNWSNAPPAEDLFLCP